MNLEIHYTPPNQSRQVVPVRDRLMIGSLLSNEVVIRAPGVEPIHAMIEVLENGIYILTDLGSQSGVYLNGQKVDVETPLKIGDKITIGNVSIDVMQQSMAASAAAPYAVGNDMARTQMGEIPSMKKTAVANAQRPAKSHDDDDDDHDDDDSGHDGRSTVLMAGRNEESAEILFSPKNPKPSTSSSTVLECVAYWDDTIIDVDMFHPRIKDNERVTIGTPGKAHFLAGGTEDVKRYKLASVSNESYSVHLRSDMSARVIKGGRVSDESGDKSIELGKNDIVHVTHGAIKYFMMFIKPPVLDLPRNNARDPFFLAILVLSTLFYLSAIPLIYLTKGEKKVDQEDIWSIVNTPDKKDIPKAPEKKKVEVVEQKPPTPVEPPKPPPKPPTPVPPQEKPKPVEKVVQPKPVEQPVKELAKAPVPPTPTKQPEKPKEQENAKAGMAKAERPDMKNPGKVVANKPQGPSGGALGGGKRNDAAGGQRQGKTDSDLKGVEGGKPNVASGVNLGALGVGVGKILDKNAAGAIKTDFKDSVGGVGGGAGSGPKTTGLGGPGAGKTLGVAGSGSAGNNFGGFGGNGSGAGGAGGLGGAGLGSGFGKGNGKGNGRANIEVPPGDPVVSGGLTQQEVQAVIRANLNQIRHCYEQLLQRSPNANGKIKVSFVISAAGTVSSSSINSDTVGDSAMAGCVTGKVQRWKFPQPRGGQKVDVTYPFVFNPM